MGVDRKSLSSRLGLFAGTLRRKQGPWIERKNQKKILLKLVKL